MKFSKLNKIFIFIVGIFALVLILNIIVGDLLFNKIVSINDKIEQINNSAQEKEKEANLESAIDNSKTDREKLASYFVGLSNAATVEFTEYLENLAMENNVTQEKSLNSETGGELASSQVVSTIRFGFKISGKWNDVYNFLQEIENLPKVVYINSVSLYINSEIIGESKNVADEEIWSADIDFIVAKLKV